MRSSVRISVGNSPGARQKMPIGKKVTLTSPECNSGPKGAGDRETEAAPRTSGAVVLLPLLLPLRLRPAGRDPRAHPLAPLCSGCVSLLGGIQPGPLYAYLHETFAGGGDDGLIQRFQLAVFPDPPPRWRNVDRWPDADARMRAFALYRQLATLDLAALDAEELTPAERPFLRFAPDAQALFDAWRAALEAKLRSDEDHPVVISHLAKYRSLMPSLALIVHLLDGLDGGTSGPVSRAAAEQAAAWCTYLEAHARRLYASVTDPARVAAALLARKVARGRLPTPFTARDVYRNAWTGLTEPRVVHRTLEMLADLGWIRAEPARAGGPPCGFISIRRCAGPEPTNRPGDALPKLPKPASAIVSPRGLTERTGTRTPHGASDP